MPIVNVVYRILYEGLSPREAVAALMRRELKPESA
jgi:glycerol-3-phosphate dehydrogenase